MSTPGLGTSVGGRYRLLRKLGEGGMSAVYEAEHTLTAKRAAVKRLHPHLAGAQDAARLIHEARATARVRHDNVVDVYDVVEQDGDVFLVMELLHGESLADLLARDAIPLTELLSYLLAAMRGMVAAHAVGVVHRDIKPENILLARVPGFSTLVPKVIDFGISKMFEHDGELVTRTGVTMGTPRYVSYEQLLGAREVDARTDIYAFGVILYESLTGRAPYGDAQTFAEQAIAFATEPLMPLKKLRPELPLALCHVVERALATDRARRWSTLAEMELALQAFAGEQQLAKLRVCSLAHAPTTPAATRFRFDRAAIAGAAIVALVALALWQYLRAVQPLHDHAAPPVATASSKPRVEEEATDTTAPSNGHDLALDAGFGSHRSTRKPTTMRPRAAVVAPLESEHVPSTPPRDAPPRAGTLQRDEF